jgi:outer membrane receptor for ferrienterochelin and colicins
MARAFRTWPLSVVLAFMLAIPAAAQTATLTGKVTAAGGKSPGAALVEVIQPNAVVAANASVRSDGSYRITGIAPGTYRVRIKSAGYGVKEFPGTVFGTGATVTLNAELELRPQQLEEVRVETVSRGTEQKSTDAPSTAFVMTRTEISERPALSIADHLKSMPGADISQNGLVQSNVVARGFNNIFSGALLTLIDYRYAAVPSLRVNVASFFPITNDDIEKVEFVLGPGAALYGPNSANGVLNILTRSPFTSTGATISFESGARAASCGAREPGASLGTFTGKCLSYLDNGSGLWRASGRYAAKIGSKVAFKVSGAYLKGTDWRERDAAEPANLNVLHPELNIPAASCNAQTGCRDFALKQWNGEARLDVRPNQDTEIIGSWGMSDSENYIEYTGIGAGQAQGWKYTTGQVRARYKRFFVQGFGNFSNSGNTFLFRDGSPIRDSSRVWSAQAQHGFDLFKGKETVLYGADYFFTDARTGGTINGSNEADDGIKEYGGYVHSVTHLTSRLDFVGALRLDKNSRLASAVWSPRGALVFKPDETSALRLTFNRAFETPDNNNLFLDIRAGRIPLSPTIGYDVRALGVPANGGFQFRAGGGCPGGVTSLCMRTPFNPAAGALPANAALLWSAAVAAVSPSLPGNIAALLGNPGVVPAPNASQVGTQLRLLNPTTSQFKDVTDPANQIKDIAPLQPTINHEIELGYKALIGGKLQVSVDGWWERKRNFVGPLIVESPTVFLDPTTTIAYLTAKFTPVLGAATAAAVAQQVGIAMAGQSLATSIATTGVPLGTVVPTNTPLTARPDIFLTYRNFGTVNLGGADLAADLVIGSHVSMSGNYSWVNKDFFSKTEVNGPTDIALNASKSKGSFTLGYHDDPHGWSLEGRVRALKGFPVNSGVYVSATDATGALIPTDSYGVFDLQGTWKPSIGAGNMLFSASLQNVLNRHYATFVGVPNLGRMLLTKLTYTF